MKDAGSEIPGSVSFTYIISFNAQGNPMRKRLSNFTNKKTQDVHVLKSYTSRDEIDLTGFLTLFIGFCGNNLGQGQKCSQHWLKLK